MEKYLQKELTQLQYFIPKMLLIDASVSAKNIAWHIDHSLRAIMSINEVLLKSDPTNYKKDFNINRLIVFAFGKIPRGRGKAPKQVTSNGEITSQKLEKRLEMVKDQLKEIEQLHPNVNFKHFVFGMMNLKETSKFVLIHTRHHLAIIRDIEKAATRSSSKKVDSC